MIYSAGITLHFTYIIVISLCLFKSINDINLYINLKNEIEHSNQSSLR